MDISHVFSDFPLNTNDLGIARSIEDKYEKNAPLDSEKHVKHICTICQKEYSNVRSYKEHLILKHSTSKDVPILICETCPFSTPSKRRLKEHIRIIHNVDKHNQCPHCDYRTPHKLRLHVHIDGKHPNHGKKNYFCDHCTRSYIFEASIKKHHENLRTIRIQAEKKKKRK